MEFTEEQDSLLRELYARDRDGGPMNDYQVACIAHMGRDSLREWRHRNGIPSQSTKKNLGAQDARRAAVELETGRTLSSVASEMGINHSSLRRLLLRNGLSYRSRKRKSPADISSYRMSSLQRSVLIGDIFGDGHLNVSSSRTAYYTCAHARAQRGFVAWKHQVLCPLSSALQDYEMVNKAGVYKSYTRMRTWSSFELAEINKIFYPDGSGHKVLDYDNAALLDAISLAVWYMGDGTRARDRGTIIVGLDNDVEGVVRKLNEIFEHIFDFRTYRRQHNIVTTNSDVFFKIIAPHVIPAMIYKVPSRYLEASLSTRTKNI